MEKNLYLDNIKHEKLRLITDTDNLDLDDLIDMLPDKITIGETIYYFKIEKYEKDFYRVSYYSSYPYVQFANSSLIDALYDICIWYYTIYIRIRNEKDNID